MRGRGIGLVLCALAAVGCGGDRAATAEAAPLPVAGDFGHRPEFADGQAEVNTYDAALMREGALRRARAYTVFVAEDLDPKTLVKADDPSRDGLLRVMKYALITSAQTGMMEYREATNGFLAAGDWRTVKLVHSHQDWCGLSFVMLRFREDGPEFRWTSYWEQDDGSGVVSPDLPADAVPADLLPAWTRGLELRDGLAFDLPVLPSLVGSKVETPAAVPGRVTVSGPKTWTVPAGRFTCFDVRVEFGGRVVELALETAFPHRVIRWTDTQTGNFTLAKSQRIAYWDRSADGDEVLLEP